MPAHPEDLSGKRFGRLTVEKMSKTRNHGSVQWVCVCDCKRKTIVSAHRLKSSETKSCGCLRIDRIKELGRKEEFTHILFGERVPTAAAALILGITKKAVQSMAAIRKKLGIKDLGDEIASRHVHVKKRYGSLTVIGEVKALEGRGPERAPSTRTRIACLCVCGKTRIVVPFRLNNGSVRDCGRSCTGKKPTKKTNVRRIPI